MITNTRTVAAPTSVVAGAATDVSNLERKTVSLEAPGTATYQLQITLDPALTAGWINEGGALSAAGTIEVTKPCAGVRWNCTAYTNGTPVSRVCGVFRADQ